MATGMPGRYRPIDALPSPAVYVDGGGCILVENDAFRALREGCGSSSPLASGEGSALPMLFAEGDRNAVREILASQRRRSRRTSRGVSLAGSLVPMVAEFVPVRRKSQGSTFWLVTLRPPQQVPEPSGDLASRAAVTAGIVHDLRTPVQLVLGWASLLRGRTDDPRRIEHALMIIERNAELMMDLLENLLEQTRPPSTRTPARSQQIDLVALVSAEVRAMQPLADENGVRLSLEIDSPTMTVAGDVLELRRVVINLLGNALKFTPRDGAVECRLWLSGGRAAMAVRDNGHGIAREFLPRVFDAFVQEPGDRLRTDEGVGLGLAVVRHLVELHGGSVTAASGGNGCGAIFTVLLPAATPAVVTGDERCGGHLPVVDGGTFAVAASAG